jgi:hypothetical protein
MARQGRIFGSCKTAATALAFALGAALPASAAASLQIMGDIGDANKASGLLRHYTLHAETRVMDATAAVPNGISADVIRKVTIETAHGICADSRGAGWTLRFFLPDQSAPIATCRFH